MAQVINTNSLSLLTQNNLNKSQGALNTAIERLSSGMRINSAKDDAAGQAIANRFTANIKGLSQAQRNANDGISLSQTTEGALNEINTNLQRVRELTVQGANGSNSQDNRVSIQAEIVQRLDEINRLSEQTDFNGTKVLKEGVTALTIQVGAQDNETITINLSEISAKTLGLIGFNVDGTGSANNGATKSDLSVAGFAVTGAAVNGTQQYDKVTANAAASSANVFSKLATDDTVTTAASVTTSLGAQAANAVFTYDEASDSFSYDSPATTTALTASFLTPAAGGSKAATVAIDGTSQDILIDGSGMVTAADDGTALFLDTTGNLTKNSGGTLMQANVNGAGSADLAAAAATGDLLGAMANAGSDGVGGTISVGTTAFAATGGAGGDETFDVTGATISAAALKNLAETGGYDAAIAAVGTASAGTASVAVGGEVTGAGFTNVDASGAFTDLANSTISYFEQSNGVVTDGSANVVYNDSAAAGTFTLNATSNSTITTDPLKAIDAALAQVDSLRGSLGAVQNRFDSIIANLGTTIVNLSSSRSRIEDADYATEVSNMTRANILQQAGTSVLAQANQTTQGILSLLQ